MRKKYTAPQAAAMLKKLGLSYRTVGEKAGCSQVTARRVILRKEEGYYSKATADKVWQVVLGRQQEQQAA